MVGTSMKHLRLSEEQLKQIQARVVERGAAVRVNKLALPGEDLVTRKRRKYGNEPTAQDGQSFDSKKEADRYRELRLMELANQIADLKRQVPYELRVNGMLVCKYIADFVYTDRKGRVVEDCKGVRTVTYRMKKKLMKACHGIDILET